jgi:hypothetical protein
VKLPRNTKLAPESPGLGTRPQTRFVLLSAAQGATGCETLLRRGGPSGAPRGSSYAGSQGKSAKVHAQENEKYEYSPAPMRKMASSTRSGFMVNVSACTCTGMRSVCAS